MGNPVGPRTGGYGQPAPDLEEAIPPGLESLPTAPAKGVGDDRAATRDLMLAIPSCNVQLDNLVRAN